MVGCRGELGVGWGVEVEIGEALGVVEEREALISSRKARSSTSASSSRVRVRGGGDSATAAAAANGEMMSSRWVFGRGGGVCIEETVG